MAHRCVERPPVWCHTTSANGWPAAIRHLQDIPQQMRYHMFYISLEKKKKTNHIYMLRQWSSLFLLGHSKDLSNIISQQNLPDFIWNKGLHLIYIKPRHTKLQHVRSWMRSYSSSVVGISPPKTQTLDPISGANSRGGQVPCLVNNNFLSVSVPFQIPLKKFSMNINKINSTDHIWQKW